MRSYTRRTLGIAAALFLASCFGDSTGPALRRRVPLSIAPVFDSRDARAVQYDKVRVHLVRQGTNELVMDTVVDFPSTADSVVLPLSVPVQGSSESLVLSLVLFTSAGDTVFRGGPVNVDVLPGVLNAAPANIPMVYVGVGANATGVSFVTIPGPVLVGDTALFVAQADTAGRPIPGTPIVYAVDARDTALAGVPNPDVGRVAAKSGRATARVIARLLTRQADTASLVIQPPPSAIVVRSGGGQTGSAGLALAQPVVVRVNAADGIGVQGVAVAFAATAGGGSFAPASALTDANGEASTIWTLGSLVGAQTMTASVGAVVSPAIGATGSPAAASKLGFTVQPVTTVAGGTLPAVTVAAQDLFGNLYPGYAGSVTLALGANPGNATLTGVTTATAAAGLATFSGLSLDRSGSGYTLTASASGLTSATSAGFNITAGAARTLSLVSGNGQSGAPSAQLSLPVVAKVSDSLGNGVSGRAVAFAPSVGGSVGTPSATTDALGLASTTWTLGTAAAESLTVTSTGLAGSPLTVTASATGGVASTTVTPHLDTLTALTATFALTAQARDPLGALTTGSFTWVSRAPAVATVSAAGVVTAVANGSTWVVATEAGGTKDSAQIVVQQRIATIHVTPAVRSIYLTRSFDFAAAAVDGAGQPMPGVTLFTWSSTAPAVASVDTVGHVVGLGLGVAQIRATSGSVIGVANVSVVTPITRIAVVVDTVGAAKTDTFTMTALGLTRRYRAIAHDTLDAVMSGLSFTWVSTNGSVAQLQSFAGDTVSVLAAANGYTQIRATAQGFTAAPGASLTVAQVLAAIALTPASAGVAVTGTVALVARGLDANGRFISGGSFKYFAADTTIAKVDSLTGVVTGVANGSTTVTATSGAITSNAAVIAVNASVPAVITFGRDTVSVGRGSSASIPILLSRPVPVGGPALAVILGTNPAAYAHWSTTSVTIPQGGTSANATLVGDSAGTTLVTATDGSSLNYAPDTAVAKVTANMRLASGGYSINATDVVATQVLLSDPSPAGGTYVTFGYGTTGIASISPDPAFIPAGQLAADIQIRGLAAGTTTITPVAIGVNGTASSFTAYPPVLSFSTAAVRLGQGQYEPYVWVSTPTGGNLALPVSFASSDTTVVTVPASATIPAGSSYVYVPISAPGLGTATVSAAATGWTSAGTIAVTSTPPAVGVCCGGSIYTTNPVGYMTVYAEDSAGSAHYRINSLVVRLHSTDPTVMQVLDSVVTVAPDQYYNNSGRVMPGGVGGTAWIVATASGHAPDSVQFTVLGPPLTMSFVAARIGAGQEDISNVYVYTPNAVTAPLVVALASSDPAIAAVPASVTIPTGSTYAYFTVEGRTPGTATITASNAGYQPASGTYVVTSPTLIAAGSTASLNNFNPGYNLTVYAADTTRGTHQRITPLTVSVVSTDPSVVSVDSAAVTIGAGQYYNNQAHVRPVGLGTARIIFSASGHATLDTLTITVVQPKLNLSFGSYRVGRRQHSYASDLYVYTPDARPVAVPVTFTQAQPGFDSLTATTLVIDSATSYKYFIVYGLRQGADTVIASAPGYAPDTAVVVVTTPTLYSANLPGTTTTTNPPFGVNVYAADSATTLHYVMDTLVVAVVSSDSNVIRPAQPYVRILKDAYYASTQVNVTGAGTASLTFSDSAGTGYLPVTTNAITVTGPSLTLANGATMLGMRQHAGVNSSYVYVPNAVASPLVVTLVSTDPRVATVPASVTIPAASSYAYFDVTAQDTVGTIQIQATATGYGAAAMNVQVTQPRFVLSTASQLNTTSPKANITVYAADAAGTVHYANDSVAVALISTAPSVAFVDSATVTIPAGAYYVGTATWAPGTVGAAQIQASDPRLQAQYRYADGAFDVAVVVPAVSFSWGTETLGIGQYIDNEYPYIPDNAVAPITVALSHVGTARIETDSGGVPVSSLTIPAGWDYVYFRIVGLSAGTDTLVGTVANPLHNPATAYTIVGPGTLGSPGGWPPSLKVGDSTQVTLYARDPAGNPRFVVAATTVTLAPNANIQFVSGGANSVVITSVTIPANAYYVQFYVKGVNAGTGSADLSATNYQTFSTPLVTITP